MLNDFGTGRCANSKKKQETFNDTKWTNEQIVNIAKWKAVAPLSGTSCGKCSDFPDRFLDFVRKSKFPNTRFLYIIV